MARAYVGTSGWSYDHWRDDFYEGVPKARWLSHCAKRFTGIEVNATFYGRQRRSTFEKWRDAVPDDFVFAVKGNRYITHNKKLSDPEEPLEGERERASALGGKLGAVLWQLPDWWGKDLERLEGFVRAAADAWPVRHALEFRHPSWFDEEVAAVLREHGVAVCLSDAADWPMWDRVTADFVYARLHGHTRTYASSYSPRHLDRWGERIRGWRDEGRDVHVYFDNDAEGAAPRNALELLERLG